MVVKSPSLGRRLWWNDGGGSGVRYLKNSLQSWCQYHGKLEKKFSSIFSFLYPPPFSVSLSIYLSSTHWCMGSFFFLRLVFLYIVRLSSLDSYRYMREASGSISLLVVFYGLVVTTSQRFISVSILLLVFRVVLFTFFSPSLMLMSNVDDT